MDYENPFSAINPQSFAGQSGGPGFVNQWETSQATEKAEMAKPFIQNALMNHMMDTKKKGIEFGEFNSPEAAQLRKDKQSLESEQTASKRKMVNPQLAADIAKAEYDVKVTYGPEVTAQKIAESKEIASQIRDKPIQKMFLAFGDFAKQLKDMDAENKKRGVPAASAFEIKNQYESFIKDFKLQHPDVTIPPNLEQWNGNTEKSLALARVTALHSVEHDQKTDLEDKKLRSQEKVAGITAGAHVQAAQITAKASDYRTDASLPSKDDTAQARKDMVTEKRFQSLVSGDLTLFTAPEAEREKRLRKYSEMAKEQTGNGGTTTSQVDTGAPGAWSPAKDARLEYLRNKSNQKNK